MMATEAKLWAQMANGCVLWFFADATYVLDEMGGMVRLLLAEPGGGKNGTVIGNAGTGLLVSYSGKRYLIHPDFTLEAVD